MEGCLLLTSDSLRPLKNALDKSKLDGRDRTINRHKIHPHVPHKFFRSKAGMVSVDIAEALMGTSSVHFLREMVEVDKKIEEENKGEEP